MGEGGNIHAKYTYLIVDENVIIEIMLHYIINLNLFLAYSSSIFWLKEGQKPINSLK
jgi:hypothetical protein